jgi:hypothetical protein
LGYFSLGQQRKVTRPSGRKRRRQTIKLTNHPHKPKKIKPRKRHKQSPTHLHLSTKYHHPNKKTAKQQRTFNQNKSIE